VPKELVETYKKSKKEAISTLLAEIEKVSFFGRFLISPILENASC